MCVHLSHMCVCVYVCYICSSVSASGNVCVACTLPGCMACMSAYVYVPYTCTCVLSHIRLFWPHGLEPASFLGPWNFPGKSTGVGCPFLQKIFLTQGSNPCLLYFLHLLHGQAGSLPAEPLWKPICLIYVYIIPVCTHMLCILCSYVVFIMFMYLSLPICIYVMYVCILLLCVCMLCMCFYMCVPCVSICVYMCCVRMCIIHVHVRVCVHICVYLFFWLCYWRQCP